MQLIYIEEGHIEQLIKEIDIQNFLKENKLIILSRLPYFAEPHSSNVYRRIKENCFNSDVMYIALGNLAYVLNHETVKILNYGPSFCEKDLIEFPIKYYQKKENKKVSAISFYYQNFYSRPHFSFEKLSDYLSGMGIRNKKILEFVDIDFKYNDNIENPIKDSKKRKLIFTPIYDIFFDIQKIEETLKKYLENGNFLVLLTFTGNHYGFPFSIDNADIADTNNYINEYRKLINFLNTLDMEADQVSNFKTAYTGINYRGKSYNFGYSHNNMNEFFEIWITYLKNKGYNIDEIYFMGKFISDIKKIKEIKNQYLLDNILTHEEFNGIVKEKVLK